MKYPPLVLLGYARPKETKKIIDIVNLSNICKVYYFVDFPKDSSDSKLISLNLEVKALSDYFDSKIEVENIFFDENLGPFAAYNYCMSYVFNREEELIFLEDDKLPSLSFFCYCKELLDRYRNDERVLFISGLNQRNESISNYHYDYFFSKINTSWGHAVWKRTYDKFHSVYEIYKSEYYKSLIFETYKFNLENNQMLKEGLSFFEFGNYNNHVASMEFYLLGPLRYLTNSVVIVPTLNLISDVGATEYTVHGDEYKLMTRRQKKIYFRETHEMTFPLKHPPFLIPDLNYTLVKTSIFTSIIQIFEKVERAFLILRFKGLRALIRKLKIYFQRN